jgi:hypothetical protein
MNVVMDHVAAGFPHEAVRRQIVGAFARAVVIIDDDVFQHRRVGEALHPLATQILQACEANGVACHLHQYPAVTFHAEDEETATAVRRAVELASRADVAVVDWNIGPTRDTESCEHAVEILRRLREQDGMRFMVVYTNDPKLDEIDGILCQQLGATPLGVPEAVPTGGEEEETPVLSHGPIPGAPGVPPHSLHIDNRIFIFVRNKETLDPAALFMDLVTSLQVALPDALQWAALEVSGRLRTVMPAVLAALPRHTDIALCHQMLHKEAENEVAVQVAEILLDELLAHFEAHPLTAVEDDALTAILQPRMLELLTAPANAHLLADRTVPPTCAEHWCTVTPGQLRDRSLTGRYFPGSGKAMKITAEYLEKVFTSTTAIDSCKMWASVRESRVLHASSSPAKLWPGSILWHEGTDPMRHEWLLCITPACDCYTRPPGSEYLFIQGVPSKDKSSHDSETQTCVYYQNQVYHIAWNAAKPVVRPYPEAADGDGKVYRFFGMLRYPQTMRIIQRVWAFQSRVGVDTSELIRALRGE